MWSSLPREWVRWVRGSWDWGRRGADRIVAWQPATVGETSAFPVIRQKLTGHQISTIVLNSLYSIAVHEFGKIMARATKKKGGASTTNTAKKSKNYSCYWYELENRHPLNYPHKPNDLMISPKEYYSHVITSSTIPTPWYCIYKSRAKLLSLSLPPSVSLPPVPPLTIPVGIPRARLSSSERSPGFFSLRRVSNSFPS